MSENFKPVTCNLCGKYAGTCLAGSSKLVRYYVSVSGTSKNAFCQGKTRAENRNKEVSRLEQGLTFLGFFIDLTFINSANKISDFSQ
jgi:hypothetical protein